MSNVEVGRAPDRDGKVRRHGPEAFAGMRKAGQLAAAALDNLGPNPTRPALLRSINEVGRFDISGSIFTVGFRAIESPPRVFLTVIQKDGTFRAIDRL